MNGLKERVVTERLSVENGYGRSRRNKDYKKKRLILALLVVAVLAIATVLIVQFCGGPIVKLNGQDVVQVEYGSVYVEEGVSAYTKFKDISREVIIENNIDTTKLGTYTVTYKVPHGNKYDTYTRSVVVKDTTPPEITLKGNEETKIEFGKEYQEEGFEAKDSCDGDLTSKVVESRVDLENGSYDKHYVVEDLSGNRAEKIRHVIVTDLTPPVIKLNGNAFVSVLTNGKYEEQGATATDTKDGNLTDKIEIQGNNIDTSKDGKYTVTYKVTDSNGNVATATRTVAVGASQATGVIYLTFDDGPSANTTPKILDVLKQKGVNATFFIINYNEANEHLVKREIEEGNAVGIHGYSHDYSKLYASVDACYQNIIKLQDKIYQSTGQKVMITRFPGGSSNTVSRKYCAGVMTAISQKILSEGFKYYDWNVASGDSGGVKTKEGVYNNVTKGIKPGRNNIVLMHDFSGNNKTLEALPDIIDYGLKNGYRFDVITTDTEMITQKIQN